MCTLGTKHDIRACTCARIFKFVVTSPRGDTIDTIDTIDTNELVKEVYN